MALVLQSMIVALLRRPHIVFHLARVLLNFSTLYRRVKRARQKEPSKKLVAIALLDRLGDVVAGEPVGRYARSQFPQEIVYWVVSPAYRDIVNTYPSIDRVITVSCMTEWLLLWATGVFHQAWDLHISERHCAKCRVAYSKPGTKAQLTFQRFYDFGSLLGVNCLAAGIPILTDRPRIATTPVHRLAIDRLCLPERFIAIHCKSSEQCKDWTKEKWQGLISWLTEDHEIAVVEVGSEAFAIPQSFGHLYNACGLLSILETAELIRRAELFVGIDSGPAHLANAVGTPGVILIGRYHSFQTYTPFSGGYADNSSADLIRTDGQVESISLERVTSAISARLRQKRIGLVLDANENTFVS